jgi:hypothetical protein
MRFLLPLAATVLTAQAGWANPALGLPFTKKAPVSYRVETREAHPDYLFVLTREVHRYDEATRKREDVLEAEYVELTPDRPLVLRHGESATLLIIPRPTKLGNLTPKELLKAHPDLARQVVYQELEGRMEVPSWFGDDITITYRAQESRAGDKLEFVRTSWHPLWQWFAVAFTIPVLILLGGLWFIRRKQRPASVPSNPPAAA